MWHEPPAWAAAYGNDAVGRRLDECSIYGSSPYNSTAIMTDIGIGSTSHCSAKSGGSDECAGAGKCMFSECSSTGDKYADALTYVDNGDGTHTYSFNVTGGASISVSHGKLLHDGTSR